MTDFTDFAKTFTTNFFDVTTALVTLEKVQTSFFELAEKNATAVTEVMEKNITMMRDVTEAYNTEALEALKTFKK